MTGHPDGIVIAAGGLGTRVAGWSPLLPKEFQPVQGRPGLVHVLAEVGAAGATRAVVVHHPYYTPLIGWLRQALAPGALTRYHELAQQPHAQSWPFEGLRVDFIAQHGRYADTTSALNGAEHLGTTDVSFVFCDNVDPVHAALPVLLDAAEPGTPAVLASPFTVEGAASHGVIVCAGAGAVRTMVGLVEKPGPADAERLAAEYGPDNLCLLQGRAHLTADLLHHLSATTRRTGPGGEPKFSLSLADYARRHRIDVVTYSSPMVDLGTSTAPRPHAASVAEGR